MAQTWRNPPGAADRRLSEIVLAGALMRGRSGLPCAGRLPALIALDRFLQALPGMVVERALFINLSEAELTPKGAAEAIDVVTAAVLCLTELKRKLRAYKVRGDRP
jgi:hypothetical protein